jgi:hypothetical protein
VIAFYSYVCRSIGGAEFPHPSGVRVHIDDDEALRAWCAEPFRTKSRRQLDLMTGMAWLDKGPSIDDDAIRGRITVVMDRAYPEMA